MALPSALKLFIDPKLGLAFGNFSGSSQITKPSFTLGDTAGIEIYLVESTQVANYPRQELPFPVSPGIKVAVGAIDESPAAGTWLMSFGGNSTSALPYNATATQLQTALNALASITSAGGVTVSKIGDNYNIAFNLVGARTELTTDSTALIPLSTAVVAVLQEGSASKVAISLVHLQRTVAGLATTFTQTEDCQITIESLGAWDGSKANYRLSISPDPKGGSFTISFDAQTGDDVSTSAIQVGASGQDVQNALNIKALADKVTVTQVGAYSYDITVATQPGSAGLTANDAGLLSFSGYVGDLSLNTAEAISLLDGAESVETTLEVEITSNSKTLTLLQIPCVLKNAVIDAGSVQPLVLDTYLSQTTADGRYLRQSNNLSDLGSTSTARTNLGVYSTSQVDTALALKADDSDLLLKADLAGAAFSGTIYTPTIRNVLNTDLVIDSYNDTGAGTHYLHKFTPFDGKLVLATNGGGLTFPDGTTQGTAFTGSLAISNVTGLQTALDGKAATSHTQATSTITGLDTQLNNKANLVEPLFKSKIIVDTVGGDGTGQRFEASPSQIVLETAAGSGFGIYAGSGGANPDIQLVLSDNVSLIYTQIQNGTFITNASGSFIEPYARKDGATFTGKLNTLAPTTTNPGLNIGTTSTTAALSNSIAGDIWIGQFQLTFKNGQGNTVWTAGTNVSNVFGSPQIIDTTATTAGLRITQKGTGNAIEVEDSTSPDSTRFVVDQFGKVGVGIAPDATAALRVDANGIKFNSGSTQTVAFIDAPSDGNYYVRRNGAWYLCIIHTQGGYNYLTV
jgi:hypothetical protein